MPVLHCVALALAFFACVLGLSGAAQAADVVINNGLAPPSLDNVIDASDDFSLDSVHVRNVGCGDLDPNASCASPGSATSAELVAGGSVGNDLVARDSSTLTMSGGSVGNDLLGRDSSALTMSGGSVAGDLLTSSSVTLSGGAVVGSLVAFQNSMLTMSSGSVGGDFQTQGSSTVTLSGGTVGRVLITFDTSHLTMSGGSVGLNFDVFDSSTLTLVGTEFGLNGNPIPFGVVDAANGTLTGILESGDLLNNPFGRHALATIRLVPEPTPRLMHGWALAVLSVLAARRRP